MLLINAVNAEGRPVELYVKDGKIAAVGQDLAALAGENETVLDAGGLTVLPAFVDLHCHWRTPGFEYKEDIETGSRAAAAGGYTFVNLMPNTKPVCSSAAQAAMVEQKAAEVGLCDVNQTVSITKDFDWSETENNRLLFEMTAKYGTPYFSNYINSDMEPSDVRSMCCRLRLDLRELRKKSGGFFGSGESTGSVGVVTINLVDVACSSYGDMDKFWKILDERLELCHKALRCRHERLLGTISDVAPILWQHGALARLKKGEKIDKLLFGGYSTISLGYAGLCEMCVRMIGKTHTSEEGKKFALAVMQKLNDKCAEWKAAENISYSVYGTPMESTTYKFAKNLQKRFGIIPGVTDKNYITNSYHVHVTEHIDAFSKLKFESEFQKLSPGGAISYVEVPNLQNNIDAVLEVMKFIYDNILYAELNTKSDYCEKCGYDGEIKIVTDDYGKLVWECPNCGNRDQNTLFVARRTCGYIGTQFWNQGRTQEIKDRVLHL